MDKTIPSKAKSNIAIKRKRDLSGRFIPKDKLRAAEQKQVKLDTETEVTLLRDQLNGEERIPEEVREAIGSDSRKFFELALANVTNWTDGYRYAKELRTLQHPTISSIQPDKKGEATEKVLKWEWDDITETSIEPVETNTDSDGV